jgi:hypothetical protein
VVGDVWGEVFPTQCNFRFFQFGVCASGNSFVRSGAILL